MGRCGEAAFAEAFAQAGGGTDPSIEGAAGGRGCDVGKVQLGKLTLAIGADAEVGILTGGGKSIHWYNLFFVLYKVTKFQRKIQLFHR